VLKKRDFILGYIRTHSNIADQFTKIVDPISHRRFRDWMAGGLDDAWEGEVVETLENLFQVHVQDARNDRTEKKCSGSSSKQTARRNLARHS
jgi:hypothetical protein